MLSGYVLVMGFLALGLRIQRRRPAAPGRAGRQGWPGLIRLVVGTAVGGYVLLMVVVVGYYRGVAQLGGRFLSSAFTGAAVLVGISLPVFFVASWLVEWLRRGRRSR
ncbi:DUF6256 family protein [Streptomyces spiramyceticus]|uniref:DUF6256 family protein n=1 Tax=Streptomyces spiramyceticus TaxID=299717 RepID=UPI00237A3ADB|nr:DUF6256 family protein [Streptomyces spiramyceticus]